MRVLVTGASGFLGGALTAGLLQRGFVVIGTYRSAAPGVPPGEIECLQYVRAELGSDPLELPRVDLVVHAAGQRDLPHATVDDYLRGNVLATQRVAEFARKAQPRLVIYLSTPSAPGAVVGEAESPPPPSPWLCGITRYLGERILAEHSDAFPTLSLRLPEVIAPARLGSSLGRVVAAAQRGDPIELADPEALFNAVIDLSELERLVLHAAHRRPAPKGVVDVAADEPISFRELAGMVVELTGSTSTIRKGAPGRTPSTIDTAALESGLGFRPARTIDIVRRQLASCASPGAP